MVKIGDFSVRQTSDNRKNDVKGNQNVAGTGNNVRFTDFGAIKQGISVADAATAVAKALGIEGLRTGERLTGAGLAFAEDLTARNSVAQTREAEQNRVFARNISNEFTQGIERTAARDKAFLGDVLDANSGQSQNLVSQAFAGAKANTAFASGLVNDFIKSQQAESTQLADTLIKFALPVVVAGFVAYKVFSK